MIKLSPLAKYKQDLSREDFQYDPAQEMAVKHLQRLYEDLQQKPLAVSGFKKVLSGWKKIYAKPKAKKLRGCIFGEG
jgi:cell division protein ZapE